MKNLIKKYLTFFAFLLLIFNHYPIAKAAEVLGDELDAFEITPKLISKGSKITPGFFYRQADADITKEVHGVYAKTATYYEESLFVDDTEGPSIKKHVFDQETTSGTKNWMGVVFFGIWSWPEEGKEDWIQTITIPVRGLNKDKLMTYMAGEKINFEYRCIWKTGSDDETPEDEVFHHIPCEGKHTETKFIEYIKIKETQKALWAYFIHETEQSVPKEKKLECIGFTIYSTNDACDSCLERLLKLKRAGLPHLVPDGIETVCSPLPFYITYESKQFYHPELYSYDNFAYNGGYSASLLFIPRPSLFRLAAAKEDGKGGDYEVRAKDELDIIKHQEEIEFYERDNPTYLILKINKGDEVRVKVA